MRRLLIYGGVFAILALIIGLWLTRPQTFHADAFDGISGDTTAGEQVFIASGCASCHAAPESKDKTILAGGLDFKTDFGTFYAPNISPDPEFGIGGWTQLEFANAIAFGTSPQGQHYYPAFPYASYNGMTRQDIANLFTYMQTLPPSQSANNPHDVPFPFNIRRALGGWKLLYFPVGQVQEEADRGQYLVEVLGHCGECHTPRNALGGLQTNSWLAGAPNPDGLGRVPNITPHADGLAEWSTGDIVEYLTSGFTPEFDSVGGAMVAVVENTARLSQADREAIAAYLKSLPALPN